MPSRCDIALVGGGIVGLATALALVERAPDLRLAVLEKEADVGRHQTGHNSGVIHAGIYYRPGSYKAKLCVEGVRLMKAFCARNGVEYEECGKVVLATREDERPALEELYRRGVANGVPGLRMLDPEGLREIEPHAAAVCALHSPYTAIVDFGRVAAAMHRNLEAAGAEVRTSTTLQCARLADGMLYLETDRGVVQTRYAVNCAGLHADRVARLMGAAPQTRIVPFRGEYYTLRRNRTLVRALIYPVPDPRFPFLGVHFTKRITGEIEAGPNAVLAFAREGYRFADIDLRDFTGTLTFGGFWRMTARYWRTGLAELHRSLSKRAFCRGLQRLVPGIDEDDLIPGGSGVRAQAVGADGSLVDDFTIVEGPRAVHVLNAPSPAATASLAIGRHIASLVAASIEP